MHQTPETTPKLYQYVNLVSRACFVANTTWSFGAVVSAFHLLWALHATPAHVRRRFVLENPHQFSAIYSMGAPNFFLTLVATGTGAIAHAAEQPDAEIGVPAILCGIIFGFLITVYLAVTGGSLLAKSMRPWKQAFLKVESLGSQDQEKQKEEGFAASAKIPISNEIMDRIESAGLTMPLLKALNNEILLEKLLVDAGVQSPGDRVRVILAVRELGDDVPKRLSVKNLQRYGYETWQD